MNTVATPLGWISVYFIVGNEVASRFSGLNESIKKTHTHMRRGANEAAYDTMTNRIN